MIDNVSNSFIKRLFAKFKTSDTANKETKKEYMQTIREKDLFNNFVDELKKSLLKHQREHTLNNQLSKSLVYLFDTSKYVRISTARSCLDEKQMFVSSIKVPTMEEKGIEIITHFRTEKHLRKPVRRLQRWLIANEMPNLHLFSKVDKDGNDYVVVAFDPKFNILHA